MLTWSEALTALKSGRDVRRTGWPRTEFLRATPQRRILKIKVDRRLNSTVGPYALSDEDQFATDWSIA